VNAPDPVYPTLKQLKAILVNDFGCSIEPTPHNLRYSPKPITIFSRKVGDETFTCPPLVMNDDEQRDREIALYICRHLRIYPAI